MKQPRKLLLFDLDGTLLLSSGAGRRAMDLAGQRLFGGAFSFDRVSFGGNLDPIILREALSEIGVELDDGMHARFRQAYAELLAAELESSRSYALPGALTLIEHVRRRADMVIGLLTGNYRETGCLKLTAAGYDPEWFDPRIWGDTAPTRPELVRAAMTRLPEFSPRRVLVIGDTPRDVACAKANACVSVAVATGGCSVAELETAGADLTLSDFSNPDPFFEFIEAIDSAI